MQGAERSSKSHRFVSRAENQSIHDVLQIKGAASAMQAPVRPLFGGCQMCCTGDVLSPFAIALIRKLLVAGRNPQFPKYQLRVFVENSSEWFGWFPLLPLQIQEDWK